jgi:hypothetical protein
VARSPARFVAIRSPRKCFAVASCAALALSSAAAAQAVLYEFQGNSASDFFGYALDRGDFDGDGVFDLVIGAPNDDTSFLNAGQVTVRSGANGSLLQRWSGASPHASCGSRVAVIGDVDGDGRSDVLIASPGSEFGLFASGLVELRSGASGAVLRVHTAPALHDGFGTHLGALGDLDLDGISEYGIGAYWLWPDPDFGIPIAGPMYLWSGASGAPLPTPPIFGGHRAMPAGDVHGDGAADYLLSRWLSNFTKATTELRTSTLGTVLDGVVSEQLQGTALGTAVGDVNGDGLPEVGYCWRASDGGDRIEIRSAIAGPLLSAHLHATTGFLGGPIQSIEGRDDLDGDGIPDLLVGMRSSSALALAAGEARVLSGVDLSVRVRILGEKARGELGHGVLVLGDLDGGGVTDYAISEPSPHFLAGSAPGIVRIYAGGTPTWVNLGWELAGTLGAPELAGTGPLTAGSAFALDVTRAAPLAPTWLAVGTDLATLPILGGFLGPAPTLVVGGLMTSASGALTLAGTWPAGVPSGARTYVQAWVLDSGAPKGVAATGTLAATAP